MKRLLFILILLQYSCSNRQSNNNKIHGDYELAVDKYEKYKFSVYYPKEWTQDKSIDKILCLYKSKCNEEIGYCSNIKLRVFPILRDTIPLWRYIAVSLKTYSSNADSFYIYGTFPLKDGLYESVASYYYEKTDSVKIFGTVGAVRLNKSTLLMLFCDGPFEDNKNLKDLFTKIIKSVRPL